MQQHQTEAGEEGRADRVTRAARRALTEYLALAGRDIAFAGVLHDLGNGASLTLAAGDAIEDAAALATIAYALLLRATALADEAGDESLAEACGDALELLEPELSSTDAVPQ